MKSLVNACHEQGDIFGTHGQYRDYYLAVQTFDANNVVQLADGTMSEHTRWAGSRQIYLCAEFTPDYVCRNPVEIATHGIKLGCAYLDIFICNEGSEYPNPERRTTHRERFDRHVECFEYLLLHGILFSSEEASDWAVPSLIFYHYVPYDSQVRSPSEPRQGVPAPLYNLVYHGCAIKLWMTECVVDGDDHMLYALLNGGAPYLIRDAVYIGVDGDMDGEQRVHTENDVERCHTVTAFHKRVDVQKLVRHEFVDDDPLMQRSIFTDGIAITCDFHMRTYRVTDCPYH